jgi:hypothetical protein
MNCTMERAPGKTYCARCIEKKAKKDHERFMRRKFERINNTVENS